MKKILGVLVLAFLLVGYSVSGQGVKSKSGKNDNISFSQQIFPIIRSHCLPCHAEDNFNPSELSMDNYELMMDGGKHGKPWMPGKPEESLIIRKLCDDPPFGDRMPLNPKKKIREGKAKWLSEEEVAIITRWIEQGAKAD